MKNASIEQFVISAIKSTLPDNARRTITLEMDLITDLGADSLSIVSIVFLIDEQFHIGAEELGTLVVDCRTVGDLVAATERLYKERAPLR